MAGQLVLGIQMPRKQLGYRAEDRLGGVIYVLDQPFGSRDFGCPGHIPRLGSVQILKRRAFVPPIP